MNAESVIDDPGLTAEGLAALLRSVWPDEPVRVEQLRPFGDGHSGLTYALRAITSSRDLELVVRLSPDGARILGPADVGRQGRIMGALHAAGLPSPQVILADSSGLFHGRAIAIMERVAGTSWEEVAKQHSHRVVAEQAIELLHRIRALDVSRTGLDGETPTSNAAEVARWSALISRCPDWLQAGADTCAAALLADVPPDTAPGLVHGDFHYGNLLFAGGRPVAIFDWEIASLGDPLTDYGCLAVASLRRRYEPEPNPTGSVQISAAELAGIYEVPPDLAAWHIAASCFKYSVILGYNLQLHRRGKKLDPIYEQLLGTARGLLTDGEKILYEGLGDY